MLQQTQNCRGRLETQKRPSNLRGYLMTQRAFWNCRSCQITRSGLYLAQAPLNHRGCPTTQGIPWKHHIQHRRPWRAQPRYSPKGRVGELSSRLESATRGKLESARISATPRSTDCGPPRHLLTEKLSWRRLQCSKTSAGKSGMVRSSCFNRRLACRARPLDGVRFLDCVISGMALLQAVEQRALSTNARARTLQQYNATQIGLKKKQRKGSRTKRCKISLSGTIEQLQAIPSTSGFNE